MIFGNNAAAASPGTDTKPNIGFNTGSNLFGAKTGEAGSNPFAAIKPAEGGLFGAKPAEGGLFGAKPVEGGGLFGAKTGAEPTKAGGMFGNGAFGGGKVNFGVDAKEGAKPAAGGMFGGGAFGGGSPFGKKEENP
jgi:nuclear pore complex protein Nup98-Nup96